MDKSILNSYEYQKATNELFKFTVKNLEEKSVEAYFNKQTSAIAIAIHNLMDDLKTFWDQYLSMDSKDNNWTIIKKKIADIKKIVEKHEVSIAKVLNCESVTIGLLYETNAYCYPLFFDKEIIELDSKAKNTREKFQLNIDFAKKLEDIIETKNGFKFKNPKGIKIIMMFGLGCFYNEMTVDECTAILLHEIGHAMQQMLVSCAMNIYCDAKANYIQSLGDGITRGSFNFFDMLKSKKNEKTKTDEELVKPHLGPIEDFDREKMKDETKTLMDDHLKIIFEYRDQLLAKENTFFTFILKSLIGVFLLTINLIKIPFVLMSHVIGNVTFHKDFLKKQVRFEQFADYMAVQNGYGAELVSGLAKLEKADGGVISDYGLLNFVYLIPILNVALTYADYRDMKDGLLLHGYPTNLQRYEAIYKGMKYELENNKNLTHLDKEILAKDMALVDEIYRSQLNHKGLRYFIFNLAAKITRKAINSPNAGANIEQNVLIPFNEAINDYKKENKV